MTGSPSSARLSTAEIIAVGTELLTPFRSDTNSLFVTARLNELGIVVRRKSIVGDDAVDLGRAVRDALDRADLLVVCGGLGPTDDDLTADVPDFIANNEYSNEVKAKILGDNAKRLYNIH